MSSSNFEDGVQAIAYSDRGIIDFDCDVIIKYFSGSKDKNDLIINIDRNPIYNTIHHECCHIENAFLLKDVFNYIDSLNTYQYVKQGIKTLLDEYLASYKAQKLYFRKNNAIERLATLNIESINKSNNWIGLYFDIINTLAFALSENQVLLELKGICPLEDIILGMSQELKTLFQNIHKLILQYSDEVIEVFADNSRKALIELLEILRADFDLLKQLDEEYLAI